jgi:hypothetical protein
MEGAIMDIVVFSLLKQQIQAMGGANYVGSVETSDADNVYLDITFKREDNTEDTVRLTFPKPEDGTNVVGASVVGDDIVFALSDGATVPVENVMITLKGEQGEQGIQGEQGVGIPEGGTTGQVLGKNSDADHDYTWTSGGAGDMLKAEYDPQEINADGFDRTNHTGKQDIETVEQFKRVNGSVRLIENDIELACFSPNGVFVPEQLTTGVASFHLGQVHSIGSALKGVIFKNKLNSDVTIPSRMRIKSNGENPQQAMNIVWDDIEQAEPEGEAEAGTTPYDLEFSSPDRFVAFQISSISREDYTGVLVYEIRDKASDVICYRFKNNVNIQADEPFNMPVDYPLFNDENRVFKATLTKEDGTLLSVATAGGKPYTKLTLRKYTLEPLASISALNSKVDKIEGRGLSEANFTIAEKAKLSELEPAKFKGFYSSLVALQTTHPTAEMGEYAFVDGGVGEPNKLYVWDTEWSLVGGESTEMTPTQIKSSYESNDNTNAFTDDLKAKLEGVEEEAQKNVKSDWEATEGDARILNKPTSLSDFINDLVLTEAQITDLDKYTKEEADDLLADKVNKVEGKGLSDRNFTAGLKAKLEEGNLNSASELSEQGLVVRKSDTEWVAREVVGGQGISVTNPKGQDGDITIAVGQPTAQSVNLTESDQLKTVDNSYDGIVETEIGGTSLSQVIVDGENNPNGTTRSFTGQNGIVYFTLPEKTFVTGTGASVNVSNSTGVNANIMAIPVTGALYENYTAEQMGALVNEYWEELKSAEEVELGSRGRNLFDGKLELGQYSSTGVKISTTNRVRNVDFIKIKPSTSYHLSSQTRVFDAFCFYDKSKNFISLSTTNGALSPHNAYYLTFSMTTEDVSTKNIVLNEGSTAMPYEPFEGSTAKIQCTDVTKFDLARLPSGVQNTLEYKHGKQKAVKRVTRYALQPSDITGVVGLTNFQTARIPNTALQGIGAFVDEIQNSISISNFIEAPNSEFSTAPSSLVGSFVTSGSSQRLLLIFPKNTYANLADAQTALAGTVIYYELSIPITITESEFADYGIEVDGVIESNNDFTEFYAGDYDLFAPISITYPTNIAQSVKNMNDMVARNSKLLMRLLGGNDE